MECSLFNEQGRIYTGVSLLKTLESLKKGPISDITVRVAISPNPLDKDPYFLLIRRAGIHSESGLYEFPGGKNKRGENIILTAFREAQKETGISINNLTDIIASTEFEKYSHYYNRRILIKVVLLSGSVSRNFNSYDIKPNHGEHDDYRIIRLSNVEKLPLSSETGSLIENIKKTKNNDIYCTICCNDYISDKFYKCLERK